MRLERLHFNDNSSITTSRLNVFIGPNSCGKTSVLNEILKLGMSDLTPPKILSKIAIRKITDLDNDLLNSAKLAPKRMKQQETDQLFGLWHDLKTRREFQWHIENIRQNPQLMEHNQLPYEIKALQFAFLDGETRLSMSSQMKSHNPQIEAPENILQALYVDDTEVEKTLSESIMDAFGIDVKLDYSGMHSLCLRVASNFESYEKDPRKSYKQFQKTPMLQSEGTGLRCYTATILSILLFSTRIILLDEPELYLHPMHQRSLGLWIGKFAKTTDCQLFIATHSPFFLSGVLATYEETSVVRLQRSETLTHVSKLAPSNIYKLVSSPLLSSQRVNESLFHQGVILCEADSDRLIYQSVADKYLGEHQHQFLFAHNKQSLVQVAELLLASSVPFGIIVDLDILHEESDLVKLVSVMKPNCKELIEQIKSLRSTLALTINTATDAQLESDLKSTLGNINEALDNGSLSGIQNIRRELNRALKQTNTWTKVKEEGIEAFGEQLETSAKKLLALLEEIGIYCVPVGELECWLDFNTRKQNWPPAMLKAVAEGKTPHSLIKFVRKVVSCTGSNPVRAIYPSFDPMKDRMKSTRPQASGMYLA